MIYRHPINSGFELPIRFSYREPRWLPVYNVSLYLGALIGVLAAGLSISARLFLIMYVLINFAVWIYTRHCKNSRKNGLEINLNSRNEWLLREDGLEPVAARLVSARILHEGLIYIKLRTATRKNYDLWLSRACTDEDNLRRLRVRLLLPVVS